MRTPLLSLAAALAACAPDPAEERLSVLLVSFDTTRADHLSCYGYERPTTPHVDALARDGVRFEEAYTPMATTLPSHASMFTSLYPRQLGVLANGATVPGEARTLAERLAESGYATGAFVSAEPLHPRYGLDQGFEVYEHPLRGQRPGAAARAAAERWLEGVDEGPFLAFVHFFDPHTWYTPPPEEAARFGAPPGPLPPDRVFVRHPEEFGPDVVTASIAAHDAELASADAELGRLLDTLDALGRREETVIAVVADHGETFDEMLAAHGYAFDHGEFLLRGELRVPLVLWLPPGVEGRGPAVVEDLVSTLDLAPTLLELLGQEPPSPAAGRSLVPRLRGEELPPRTLFAERRSRTARDTNPLLLAPEYAVVADGWQWVGSPTRGEFLHALADPDRDVRAEHPEVAEDLSARHAAWRAAHAEPLYAVERRVLGEEERAALRALGYADDE